MTIFQILKIFKIKNNEKSATFKKSMKKYKIFNIETLNG